MDYATSPVSVTPGPQPTASSERNISAAETTGFHGLLQRASTDNATGKPAQDTKTAQDANTDVAAAQTGLQTQTGDSQTAIPAKLAVAYTENGESAVTFTATSPALQQDAHAMAMAIELGADIQSVASAEQADIDTITAKLPAAVNAVLGQSQSGSIDLPVEPSTPALHRDLPAADNLSVPIATGGVPAEIESNLFTPAPAAVTVNSLGSNPAGLRADTAALTDEAVVTLPSRGLDLSKPLSLTPTTVPAQPADSSVVQGTAQSVGEPLMIAGRVGSAPLLQGQSIAADPQAADQAVIPRSMPVVNTTALPVDVKSAAASAELASTHAASVSVSATTVSTARELMARQRSGVAANDETVSQITRGGTEARMIEVNGARATSAVTTTPINSTPVVDAKTEQTVTLTNAAALAATRDEKVLRVSADAATQKQPVAKIGGVDVSQLGSVDVVPARLDAAVASQSAPKLAILEPGWTSQLGSDLRLMVARGPATTQVQVTPAELGPLDIEVSINRQEVSVRILAMHGQTREMLEAALPRLRDTLGQSYTSVDVSVGSGGGNSTPGGQQHNGQAGTLGMMSGNQGGLSDTESGRNAVSTESSDSEEGVGDLSMDDQDELIDGNSVAAKPSAARGLVDAYA